MEFKRIAVDTSKSVFTLHGVDEHGRPILRQDLTRARFETFLGKTSPTEVVLEACGSSHHWGRVAQALGHTARLIPPQYVKPFVKRGKNNRNDAEAIGEAAFRPTMRFVPVKSAETPAEAMDLSARDLLVRQRTQLVNAVRGHAAEFGIIAAKGIAQVEPLLKKVADSDMPQAVKQTLAQLGRVIAQLDSQLAEVGQRLVAQHKANPVSRQCLGGISRAGNERLRQLLVVGAMAVIRHAKPGSKTASPWLLTLLECWPRKVAAVALANKMARILWAELAKVPTDRLRSVGMPAEGMMANGTAYRRTPQAA